MKNSLRLTPVAMDRGDQLSILDAEGIDSRKVLALDSGAFQGPGRVGSVRMIAIAEREGTANYAYGVVVRLFAPRFVVARDPPLA
jgi:hypothetical protein